MINIVLCGFMGSGKSQLGKDLARHFSVPFEDLDQLIESSQGARIQDIFARYGQDHFRTIERETLLNKVNDTDRVLSLGGGSLSDQFIVDTIKKNNTLVFISPTFETLIERIQGKTKRPLVLNENGEPKSKMELFRDLKPIYDQRLTYYSQADLIFEPQSSWDPSESVHHLIQKVSSKLHEI